MSSTLSKEKRDEIRAKDSDSTITKTGKARARVKNLVIDLWRKQQDVKRATPGIFKEGELPATNPLFASAMAQVVLDYYGIPYRTVVGSIGHWSIPKGKTYPWVWLESPKPKADGSGWTKKWRFVTDAGIYSCGTKVCLLAGQEFNIGGAPKAEAATFHPCAIFARNGELVWKGCPHPGLLDKECSMDQMLAVASSLQDDYVLATEMRREGGHSRPAKRVGLHQPEQIRAYFRDFRVQIRNT